MQEPNYKQAFSHSWQMIKEHKILWIFGLLSVCLGQWGLADFIGGLNLVGLDNFTPVLTWTYSAQPLFNAFNTGTIPALLVVWLLLIAVLMLVLTIFMAVVSRGALIAGVGHWFAKKGKISYEVIWKHGVKNFWKLFLVVILTRSIEIILLLLAVIAFSFFDNSIAGFVAQAIYSTLTLTAGLILEAVMIFASGYIVIDGADVSNAVKRGWHLFTKHVLITLEVGILLMVASLVVAGVVALAGFFVIMPAFLLWGLAFLLDSSFLIMAGIVLASSLFMVILALAGGMFNAFNTSVWMYLFVKMHRESYIGWVFSKIKKLFVR